MNDLKRYIEHHIGSHPSFFAKIKNVSALDAYRHFLEHETARAYNEHPSLQATEPVPELVIPGADHMTPQQIQAVLRGSPRIPTIRWADYSDDDDDDEDLYAGKRKLKKSKKSKKPKKPKKPKKRPKSKKKKYRKKKNKTARKK